jgi:hypothetical protein
LKKMRDLEWHDLLNIESPQYVRWEINKVTFNINDLNRSKIRNLSQFVWENYCRNTGRKFGEYELERLIRQIEVGSIVLVKYSEPPKAPMFEYIGPDALPARYELYWGYYNQWRYIGGNSINPLYAQQIIAVALRNSNRDVLCARRYDLVPTEVLIARGEYEYVQEREELERRKKQKQVEETKEDGKIEERQERGSDAGGEEVSGSEVVPGKLSPRSDAVSHEKLKEFYRTQDSGYISPEQLDVNAAPPSNLESLYIPRNKDGSVIPLLTDDRNIVVYPLEAAEGRAVVVN